MLSGPDGIGMIVSQGEVAAALKKAAAAAGWPWGLAEEIAAAGTALVRDGLDGVSIALDAVAAGFAPALVEPARWGWILRGGRAGSAGASAVDLLRTGTGTARIRIERADQPLLLAGFAAQCRTQNDCLLAFGDGTVLRIRSGRICKPHPRPAPFTDVEMTALARAAAATVSEAHPPAGEIRLPGALWIRLQEAAARSHVPATARSRRTGAGAGAIDND